MLISVINFQRQRKIGWKNEREKEGERKGGREKINLEPLISFSA